MCVAKRVNGCGLVLVKTSKGKPAVEITGRAGMESLGYILPQLPVNKHITKFEPLNLTCK